MKQSNSQLVILGSGDPSQEKAFEKFSQKYPTELVHRLALMMVWQDGFSEDLIFF